jgi:hypothetical protein
MGAQPVSGSLDSRGEGAGGAMNGSLRARSKI